MYRLIICEKPAAAQSIAAALGIRQRREGYLEGKDTLVSWCIGHLAGLADAETYNAAYAKWRISDLPILPESWRFTIDKEKGGQFDTLRALLRREDVAEVVNACDAGREGELIFGTAYHLAGCEKPVKRLWISSMEDEAIRQGFSELRDGWEYDGLYQSALCRAKADWLVGINATRLFSVLYHRTLNIGRVVSPTLALLVQRDAEIGAFKPEPFYIPQLDCGEFTAAGDRKKDRKEAEAITAACKDRAATVRTVERKEKSEKAPALYDLTTLQREANRTLGYTAQQTLDYLQSLYEKKLCTYPRTDSRFLPDDMAASVPALVDAAAVLCGMSAPETVNAGQVTDSKKVTDHHAIVPTKSAADTDPATLPAGEREILRLIAMGLLRAVSESHRYAETTVTVECGGHLFTVKGKTILVPGWKSYGAETQKDTVLPDLAEGQTFECVSSSVKEGKTTPPKPYTEDTLLSAMESAGKEDMPEDAERKGIGTPATRAAILEKLVSSGFAQRKKGKKTVQLIPTHAGVSLITVLPEQLQSPQLTAEWEHNLKQIERGELSPEDFMDGIAAMLRELTGTYETVKDAEVLFPSGREVIGKCPYCGGDVTESKQGFFCERHDCRFAMWKDNKFFTYKRATLTKALAKAFLKDGQAKMTGLYSEKTGKTYDALVVMDTSGGAMRYKLVFGNE